MLKSRKINLVGKLCLTILLAALCLGLPINKVDAAATLTADDMKLGGLGLDSIFDEFIERYGNPDKVEEIETSIFRGDNPGSDIVVHSSFQGGLLEVAVLKTKNILILIRTRDSNLSTPRNIAVGNLDKDMFNAYGNYAYSTVNKNNGNLVYGYEQIKSTRVLIFEVNPNTRQIMNISIE